MRYQLKTGPLGCSDKNMITFDNDSRNFCSRETLTVFKQHGIGGNITLVIRTDNKQLIGVIGINLSHICDNNC